MGYKTEYITLDSAKGEAGRASWVYIFTPDKKGKYKCDLIFDKASPALKKLKALRKEVFDAAYPGLSPKKIVNPIKDGDEKFDEDSDKFWMYEGTEYITLTSSYPVKVYDMDAEEISAMEQDKFYPGCHAVAYLNAYDWTFTEDNMTKKGIGFGFEAIQKVKDDERFGGGGGIQSAQEAGFKAVGAGSSSNYGGDDAGDDDDW